MASDQRAARIVGWLFIGTFVFSIPGALLYGPILHHHATYVLGGGHDTEIALAAFLELLTAICGIGTAVALFPVVKRQSEGLALGYVAVRIVESTIIVAGIVTIMAIVTLRQDLAGTGANAGTLSIAARSLIAVKDWTFLLGPGFCAGLGNGLILGYLMYRSGLVPRRGHNSRCSRGSVRLHRSDGRTLGRLGQAVHAAGHPDVPGNHLGGVLRHLPRRQGVQDLVADPSPGRATLGYCITGFRAGVASAKRPGSRSSLGSSTLSRRLGGGRGPSRPASRVAPEWSGNGVAAVNAGQTATACAGIPDYLDLVKAQTGKKLTPAQANRLTTDATDLAERLRGRRARLHRADGKHASGLCARGLTAAVSLYVVHCPIGTALTNCCLRWKSRGRWFDLTDRPEFGCAPQRRRVRGRRTELIERADRDRARRQDG